MTVITEEKSLTELVSEKMDNVDVKLFADVHKPYIGKSIETKRLVRFIEIGFDTKNVPVLWGPPGVGKTAIIHSIVARRNMFMRIIIGSTMDPTDVAGMPVIITRPDGNTMTTMALPEWFLEVNDYALAHPEGAVIFIEEITTAPPPVQAALLTFIQDRRIGKHVLPDNVLIIVAGNPPEQAADGNLLAAPTANRLAHFDYKPSIPDWLKGMSLAWNKEVSETEQMFRGFVVGFLTENTKLINACPEDADEAGKAWPSMRSWDNAARMLGQVNESSVTENKMLAKTIVYACVGESTGKLFMSWMNDLKLPDYHQVMDNPDSIGWRTLRGDELLMTLSTVIQNISAENFEASVKVFYSAKSAGKDDILSGLIIDMKKKTVEVYKAAGMELDSLPKKFTTLSLHILGDMYKKSKAVKSSR